MKMYSLITAKRGAGFTFTDTSMEPILSEDPSLYFQSRLLPEDSLGRPMVATPITDNPHCVSWPWTLENTQPRPGHDWFGTTGWRIGETVWFMWEEPSTSQGWHKLGTHVRGVIAHPHINYGDWIVQYQKPPNDWDPVGTPGIWIHRVVNQRLFWRRDEE